MTKVEDVHISTFCSRSNVNSGIVRIPLSGNFDQPGFHQKRGKVTKDRQMAAIGRCAPLTGIPLLAENRMTRSMQGCLKFPASIAAPCGDTDL
ncbi:hypothetical protein IWQ55_003443 [Labrenzia sp. EL_208]|uniref:hypothetical protein n=1 Tax=Roseibium album TaxID=311410 RepID=UPI0006D83391|nr:hypothetical protein [Roseibium album]MBG6175612.1 hypothetical protein [Labrenzia sp. EL_132]MBG6230227.1 hypothetical protein [Labrenzia sp. EL_208]MCR9055903.1 hypothetical protein [Paracoccaceae bacterium]